MVDILVTKEKVIRTVNFNRPHIVILGAGASKAALPNGDKYGRKIPLMNDFVETLKLEKLLSKIGINVKVENFEDIYSDISENPKFKDLCDGLENAIYDYFSSLQLPNEVTIYDLLILSLRQKDVIATFNWDPCLIQAIKRNLFVAKPPSVFFLHGNVLAGFCIDHNVSGLKGLRCSDCGRPLKDSKLLYPIKQKNYHVDPFISSQWDEFEKVLNYGFMLTIFGYSAPKTDKDAVTLLKKAWNPEDKRLESVEIIDLKSQFEIFDNWKEFIEPYHHCEYLNSFYDSWIFKHPRRTGEAHKYKNIEGKVVSNNRIPNYEDLERLHLWFSKIIEKEN